MMMNNGREGDWECSGCRNRNYAFRSFCNRCKQPRLLVDIKTPADSKWLPRIGDWICIGCSNNNYASREKCKKCGQSREEAAMPAMAMLGARMNYGTPDTCFLRPNSSTPPVAGWPFSEIIDAHHHANSACNVIGVPKGWREGDWMCICGFHNYASRAQCKKCNAPSSAVSDVFRGPGIKRVASEEFVHEMDSKRRNGGDKGTHLLMMMPGILGKGAKQWRDGDWMCSNCSNHNFANRSFCNRCKTERGAAPQPVSVI